MPRKSPRSRRKTDKTPKLPAAPRVRSAPGQSKTRESRAAHMLKGARGSAATPPPKKSARARLAPRSPRRAKFFEPDRVRVRAVLEALAELYPDARCALDFTTPLQLLVATILSAQCTDERVNMVTPDLFAKYPDAAALAAADQKDIERLVHSTGFFRNKAKSIISASADIVAKHAGQVPRTIEELTALRGVGRKTANVVLGNAYSITSGIVVDTHVTRVARRLGLTDQVDAVKIELALMPLVPRESWTLFSHWLILHGRQVCHARKPRCSTCPLSPHCPKIGVTAFQ